MFQFRRISLFSLLGLILAGSVIITFPTNSCAQDEELFNTSSIERSITTRFKLSKFDRLLIHDMIERENRVLVLSYFKFSESNTDFLSLWNKARIEHREAETFAGSAGMIGKQKAALEKALEELERRVLEMWLDDYVSGLTDVLELDRIQMDCISKIFQRESERRRKVLAKESKDGFSLNAEWDQITHERNACLRAVLDPLQLHDYNLLYATNDLIA